MALKDNLRRTVVDTDTVETAMGLQLGAMVDVAKAPVMLIPLAKILDNPYQYRGVYTAEHVLGIADSLRSLKAELPNTLGLQQVPSARVGKLDPTTDTFEQAPRLLYSDVVALRRLLAQRDTVVQLHFGHSRLRAFMALASGPQSVWPEFSENVEGPLDPDYGLMPLMLGFADERAMWRYAVTENSQRKNATAIDEAHSIQRAIDEFGLTLEEAGAPFGYGNRSTVSNKVRLLRLPADIQKSVANGTISERHARELLQLEADPAKLTEIWEKTVKSGWTVVTLGENVKWEAKRLKERQEVQRQLDAARMTLEAGWTPPASTDLAPLPPERLQVKDTWIQAFNLDDKHDSALLLTGVCGAHCACCVVGHVSNPPDGAIRPNPTDAPNICLACSGGWGARQEKIKILKTEHPASIQATEAEQALEIENAKRKAAAADLNRAARIAWNEGLVKLDLDGLLNSLDFWRIALEGGGYGIGGDAKEAKSMADFRDRLLERLFNSTQHWNPILSDRVYHLDDVDKLVKKLAMFSRENKK